MNFNSREDVDLFFKAMDRDFDGRLTLEEFMGEETPIEKLFKLMDKNRDGFITKKVQKRLFSLFFHLKIYRNFSLSARRWTRIRFDDSNIKVVKDKKLIHLGQNGIWAIWHKWRWKIGLQRILCDGQEKGTGESQALKNNVKLCWLSKIFAFFNIHSMI